MVNYLIISCLALSFFVTSFLLPPWIKAARRNKLVGRDMNKYEKPEVAEMGGIAINAGFLTGLLAYVGISTFYFHQDGFLVYLFAAMSTVLIIMVIGLLDDFLGWKIGLRQWQKPLLTMAAAFPMMVVNAGESTIILPIVGSVDFGILFPLMIIPLGITGAANGFNMLAGYNGLEAGMGIIILGVMGMVSWSTGNAWVSVMAFSMVAALAAFMRYNWYPARIFPGDTMSYSVGALMAVVAILGNMEKIALVLFLPYFMDFLLPLRKKMRVEAFARPNPDNSLEMPYGDSVKDIYDSAHLAIYLLKKVKRKVYESDVTLLILGFEAVLGVLVLIWVL